MLPLKHWKVVSCVCDFFIIVLFVVQVVPHHLQQELHYKPHISSIDVVAFSIGRALLQAIIYICVKSTSIIPEIVIFLVSLGCTGGKGYLLYIGSLDQHVSFINSESTIILLYSSVVAVASLCGTLITRRTSSKEESETDAHFTHKESMWATKETSPLLRSINDGSGSYRTSTSPSISSASSAAGSTASFPSVNNYYLPPAPPTSNLNLLPSEGRYFEKLPSATNLYLYDDKPKQLDKESDKDRDQLETPPKPKAIVMPSIPRLIVLMLAPGTGIPLKEVKSNDEKRRCFSGKVCVDWILTVMPRIKNRGDCLHIAQQLVDKQFILPLKSPRQKSKSPSSPANKFLDDDNAHYYFTAETDSITGTYRADSNILGAPQAAVSHLPPFHGAPSPQLSLPPQSDRYPFDRPVRGSMRTNNDSKESLNQFLAPPKISSAMRNFLLDMSNPHSGVPIGSHTINTAVYSNCFSGGEAVGWMMARMGLESREDATKILNSMLSKNILLSVYPAGGPAKRFEDSDATLYTFCSISSEEQGIQPIQQEASTPPPSTLSPAPIRLEKQMLSLTPPDPATLVPNAPLSVPNSQPKDTLQSPQSSPPSQPVQITQSYPQPPQDHPSQSILQENTQLSVETKFEDTIHSHQELPPTQSVEATLPPQLPIQTHIQLSDATIDSKEQPELAQEIVPEIGPIPNTEPIQSGNNQEKSNIKNNKKLRNALEPTVSEWLHSINCSHLAPLFDSEDITFDIIPIMDHEDLENLNIHPSDIKVLLKHIKVLKASITKQAEDKLKQNKRNR